MLTWEEAVQAVSGEATGGRPGLAIPAVATDSRRVEPGALFVCLRGEHFDGHAFALQALSEGAGGILAQAGVAIDVPPSTPIIRVPDTLRALGDLARAWRRKHGGVVVAVTGSSGKTSTKEMLAAYFGKRYQVLKTEANYNNEIGVPLTLLGLRPEHELAIVEMGMRAEGEIAYLASVAEPDVGVVTNVGSAHIGRLGSREAIARAKAELWRHMPEGKTAIVPFDDPLASREAGAWGGKIVSWSLSEPAATVWSHDVRRAGEGQVFTVYWKAGRGLGFGRAEVKLPFWGDHHRANALMAVATGWALGIAPEPRLELRPDNLPGRARQLDVAGVLVTDDAYNANPESMRAALKAFSELPGHGRRIAVIGDMAELGEFAPEAHREVGAYAAKLGLDEIVGLGTLAAGYCAGAGEQVACTHFTDAAAAVDHLASRLQPGDRVLLKASRAGRFETVIERLAARLEGRRA